MTLGAPSPSPASWEDDLTLITAAARAAGTRALEFFRREPEVWWKNHDRSPVSAADYAANDILKGLLLKARPDYGWLSEETDDDETRRTRDTVFVVDPIDGTRAFIAGKDVWCVSVGVVHQGRPVAGVLYAPALDETFQASLSGPALKNSRTITVSSLSAGAQRRFASAEDMVRGMDAAYGSSIDRVSHIPSLAYRLAMVADGRLDGTIVKKNSHDWDLAAADLILDRAGGSLVDLDGLPLSYNRPTVVHGVLCAAPKADLAALLRASQGLHSH
ncbi:3'(2'),5'-bisphosphate nucleotidase CysQ [Pararhizobium sp.]|uniref:3'(2'),5'-bisphosphate nucleotidase CysQ n=1 Tax=Pararhizobium sp. TaxID=1977563 RepID=UPI0027184E5C|nr:3'(2'),5'-bisphosphate nucleotidase CysQ [Pararhizobium sp.]MDO9415643.1 3'(2'),5'-bisphosphate nucleotidase CysQ [Pararhizobium sp.]